MKGCRCSLETNCHKPHSTTIVFGIGTQTACALSTRRARLRGMRLVFGRRMFRTGAVRRLGCLLVGFLSTPGVGLMSVQRSHCATHESSVTHSVHPSQEDLSHGASAATLDEPAHSDCTHCPPSECASILPCAGSVISLVAAPSVMSLQSFPTHGTTPVGGRTAPRSTTRRPPTPPPQFIS
jgi:hypothetical protein